MYRKQQHAVLAYVQQAVDSSNEQCSKQQQQQAALLVHAASTSTTQLLLLYVCSLGPSRSSTLLSILPYIAENKQQQTNLAASYSTLAAVAVCCCNASTFYDIIFTWYVHTHSSILNIYLCTHYIQQHCCKMFNS